MKTKKRLFRKCPTSLLILIEDEGHKNSINQVARKAKFQYAHVINLINLFLENNLITKKKFNKRTYNLFLTEKGKKIVNELREIIGLLE